MEELRTDITVAMIDQLYPPRVAAGQSAAPEVVHDVDGKAEEQGRQGCHATRSS